MLVFTHIMKKLIMLLAVAAFVCSPLLVTEAQAGQGKGKAHRVHQAKHHHGKHHHKH